MHVHSMELFPIVTMQNDLVNTNAFMHLQMGKKWVGNVLESLNAD